MGTDRTPPATIAAQDFQLPRSEHARGTTPNPLGLVCPRARLSVCGHESRLIQFLPTPFPSGLLCLPGYFQEVA